MSDDYKTVDFSSLSRTDEVRFRYLPGTEVRFVKGLVDKISKSAIDVGNEYHMEPNTLIIYHTKRYERKKIECLEKRVRK